MPNIQPGILKWAREKAGLSQAEAARKLDLKDGRRGAGSEQITALEEGMAQVTRPLLLKMVKVYRRPLLTFYLKEPPREGERGQDFRNLPDRDPASDALVDAVLRDVKARQSMVRSMLEESDDPPSMPFIGSCRIEDGVDTVVASIRRTVGFDLTEFRSQDTPDAAFALLRSKVEAMGIFVLLIGNLGSHHSAIPVKAFRGFALADKIAPFIVINDQDAKAAWSFTLLHELAHLWIGASGVSGGRAESQTEKFCNDVASMTLLPPAELSQLEIRREAGEDEILGRIGEFASDRLLSRRLVAYRLFRSGVISEATWNRIVERIEVDNQRRRVPQREAKEKKGGPNFYVVRRHRLGTALLRVVAENLQEGSLTPTKASRVLGIKPRQVPVLLGTGGLTSRPAA
ncbi:MAG TPA: XRE family transcriptional regulator [Geminicoccus sp.]|jgi:Zn-dependent peptidase ImmA (M78 family)/transcriptional regulator with XRE-family HTH domain|uniref:ImmA/IrrE family metallo-endopeptidase n=1 Tax=Geminicoccus sp. TaxID=2024832 RepID=UPI002E37D096|nr:XRE family transcriptional regulator [Geminicoccus sp.]HEX2526769.1 XRE family transcriptional regulator [Geminicoccus sp.]